MDRVVITKGALFQRLRRRLAKDGHILKATRGERYRHDLGDFFTVDEWNNVVVDRQINLEPLGRELGVLKAYEQMEDD